MYAILFYTPILILQICSDKQRQSQNKILADEITFLLRVARARIFYLIGKRIESLRVTSRLFYGGNEESVLSESEEESGVSTSKVLSCINNTPSTDSPPVKRWRGAVCNNVSIHRAGNNPRWTKGSGRGINVLMCHAGPASTRSRAALPRCERISWSSEYPIWYLNPGTNDWHVSQTAPRVDLCPGGTLQGLPWLKAAPSRAPLREADACFHKVNYLVPPCEQIRTPRHWGSQSRSPHITVNRLLWGQRDGFVPKAG